MFQNTYYAIIYTACPELYGQYSFYTYRQCATSGDYSFSWQWITKIFFKNLLYFSKKNYYGKFRVWLSILPTFPSCPWCFPTLLLFFSPICPVWLIGARMENPKYFFNPFLNLTNKMWMTMTNDKCIFKIVYLLPYLTIGTKLTIANLPKQTYKN